MADPFDYAVQYYQDQLGLTLPQARGAVRWMQRRESGLNPSAFNPAGGGQGALGIGQWRGSRQRALLDQYGPTPSLQDQLAFSVSELKGPERGALAALRQTNTEDQAFNAWGQHYERPGAAHPGDRPEGVFGGALHLNIHDPNQQEGDTLSWLLAASAASDRPQQPPQDDALALLNSFIEPPGRPQTSEAPGGTQTPAASPLAAPPRPAPPHNLFGDIPGHVDPLDHLIQIAKPPDSPMAGGIKSPNISPDTIEPPAVGQVVPPVQGPPPSAPMIGAGGREIPAPTQAPRGADPPPNEADPLTGILQMAKDIGNVPVGLAERAMLGAWNMGGALVGQRPTERSMHAPTDIAPGLQRIGDIGMAAGMPGIGAAGHAAPPQVARGVEGAVEHAPDLIADTQGATPIPQALQRGIKDAATGIEKVFSPSSVDFDAEFGSGLVRREVGQARRSTEQAEAQVSRRGPLANPPAANVAEAMREPWRPLVNRYIPDFNRYIVAKQAGQTPPKPALLRFLDFVEGMSQAGAQYQGPPELFDLAYKLRKIYKQREMAIAAEPSTQWAGFIDDYYAHQWTDPAKARLSFGAPRQGSGRNLRQRSIPTISEGVDRGLVPASLDPIGTTMTYVANMDRYLAHNRIFRIGRESDMIKFYQHGQQPEGWMPLEGRLAERAVATGGIPEAIGLKAYAPEGFARVYNNAVSTGFLANQLGGPVYTTLLHAKNGITQSVLALSGYHYLAMAQESMASGIARGIADLTEGEIKDGLKQAGLVALAQKPIRDFADVGRKMERQYLGVEDFGPDFERVADLYAKAGGRMVGRGAEYANSAADNYFKSFRRGALRLDLQAGLKQSVSGNPLLAAAAPIRFLAREVGRLNETVTAPLFDKIIPRLKAAAFYDEMSGWIKAHPNSLPGEQLRQARVIADTIDDRYGEMVMDNIFWGQRTKQTLQLLATSLGWELGSVRSLGGAPLDAVRGKFTPRVRYAFGLASAVALENAAYQYLKSGKTPGQDTGGALSTGGAMDLGLSRTGGQTPEGNRERAILPGFEKDVLGYSQDPLGEFAGKLSPFARLGLEGLTGRDWQGHVIAPFPKYTPEWFKAWGRHVVGSMTPIPLAQDRYKRSNISGLERMAGVRPAPAQFEDPDRVDRIQTQQRIGELRGQLRGLYAHGARTTEERKSLDAKAKEIVREIEELNRGLVDRTKDRAGSRVLYRAIRPTQEARP